MIRRVSTAALGVALLAGMAAAAGGPSWVKWDQAKKMAAATGKPIIVYATVNEEGGGC